MRNSSSNCQLFNEPESGEAMRIIAELSKAGFVALLAGGCVRDALLGKPPKDYDVATDAVPEKIREVFGRRRTLAFGESFGVIGVLPSRIAVPNQLVQPTEVATFRSDGRYSDGRRPDSVRFGDAREDALRRDFTINGLFFDPAAGDVIDYVGGRDDLAAGVLRTIGQPALRFGEDKLRMLRAIRFATTLGFRIDAATRDAIRADADQISVVSGERMGAEMRRVLASPEASVGLRHLIDCRLDRLVMPEISGIDLDRVECLIRHLEVREFCVTLTCVLLHVAAPEKVLRAITRRWKLSNDEVRRIEAALKYSHLIRRSDTLPWSTLQPILTDRNADTIVAVAAAVAATDGDGKAGIERANRALRLPDGDLDPPPLVTGDDLRSMGIPAGPKYREILQTIRDEQLDGKTADRDAALQRIRSKMDGK